MSTVRLGAGNAPLSTTITAGRTAPVAVGGALRVSRASSMASARSTLTVACRSAPSALMTMSRNRACPALIPRVADAFDTGKPALSSAPPTNSRMRLFSVGIPSSMARVTESPLPRPQRLFLDTPVTYLKGVGPARARLLLRRFGSVQALKGADPVEIAAAVGPATARAVTQYLRDSA